MIRIYEATSAIEAHLLRGLLEQRGIPVHIVGEHLLGAVGDLPAHGLVGVLVPEAWVAEARAVVHEYDTGEACEADLAPDAPVCVFDPAEPDARDRAPLDERAIGLLLAGAGLGFLTLVHLARGLGAPAP